MRFMIGFAVAAMLAASAHAEGPGNVSGLPPFKTIELRHDGVVEVRHGPAQQVILAAGDRWADSFTVADGRLVIRGCNGCGANFRVVVVTPSVEGLGTVQGGTISVTAGFPRQARLALKVEDGGTLQAMNLAADRVAAEVVQAGRIEAAPIEELVSKTAGSGAVVHTGNPKIIRRTQP